MSTGASSSAGKRALEFSSSYSASKFGVRGLTQSAGAFFSVEEWCDVDLKFLFSISSRVGEPWYHSECVLPRVYFNTHEYVS
jgi:hypothetical protein